MTAQVLSIRYMMDDSKNNTGNRVLADLLVRGQSEAVRHLIAIGEAWPSLVGEKAFDHSWPKELSARELLVEVDHPGWLQRLRAGEKELLAKLSEVLPEARVLSIAVKLGRPESGQRARPSVQHEATESGHIADEGKTPRKDSSDSIIVGFMEQMAELFRRK